MKTMLSSAKLSGVRVQHKQRQGAAARRGAVRTQAASVPPPVLFTYDEVTSKLAASAELVAEVESCFGELAKDKVDVPIPMHIGIAESGEAGPGDCHIKGGYVEGSATWTVKLANVSFYKNVDKGLPAGSGIFVVCDATNGSPLAVFQENRFMTDLRTGAAGAVSVKQLVPKEHTAVSFVGAGVIAKNMAEATATIHTFTEGYAYGTNFDRTQKFCDEMSAKLGYPIKNCATAEECVRGGDVVFTQTPGSSTVLELDWLKPHATIIASGSDQPTKNEIPAEVLAKSKMVCDLVRQCTRVGELRSAVKAGLMEESDVYAELGEIINGTKSADIGNELVVVDLTGTGAQDAAIGQVAWNILSKQKVMA